MQRIDKTVPLLEGFMFFFNVWMVFIIVHLGRKYVITDVISRFIHEPYAMGLLTFSVLLGLFGMIFKKPKVRFLGSMISTFWWGAVWMLFLLTLKTIFTLGFSVYGLPLMVSVTVMTQNYQRVAKRGGEYKHDMVK